MNLVHTKWEKYHIFVFLNQLSSTVTHLWIPTHAWPQPPVPTPPSVHEHVCKRAYTHEWGSDEAKIRIKPSSHLWKGPSKILQFTLYFRGCLIWSFVSCNLPWVTLRVYGFGWARRNGAPHFWGHFTLLVLSDWRAWVLNTSSLWSFLPFSFWLSCFPASNPLPRSSPALALHYF